MNSLWTLNCQIPRGKNTHQDPLQETVFEKMMPVGIILRFKIFDIEQKITLIIQ